MEVIPRNVIKCHHLFIRTFFLCICTLSDVSLLQCWIMDDVLTHNQICGLGLQISFVDTILELIAILGHLSAATHFALVEQSPLGPILGFVSVEHVVALLAESLPCELSCH